MSDRLQRLATIREYEDGWADGAGLAVTDTAALVAREFLLACDTGEVESPHVFASLEGGIMLEVQPGEIRLCIEIERDGAITACQAGGKIAGGLWEIKTLGDALDIYGRFLRRVIDVPVLIPAVSSSPTTGDPHERP